VVSFLGLPLVAKLENLLLFTKLIWENRVLYLLPKCLQRCKVVAWLMLNDAKFKILASIVVA
jgi:hypothetical protein